MLYVCMYLVDRQRLRRMWTSTLYLRWPPIIRGASSTYSCEQTMYHRHDGWRRVICMMQDIYGG